MGEAEKKREWSRRRGGEGGEGAAAPEICLAAREGAPSPGLHHVSVGFEQLFHPRLGAGLSDFDFSIGNSTETLQSI